MSTIYIFLLHLLLWVQVPQTKPISLFDAKTFKGWEGDTLKTWRIEDGSLIGGSLTTDVPHNEFIATRKSYKNFDLRLTFKLQGTSGFVNAGVQFHSRRLQNPPYEMEGYQADLGDGWWAGLYDESRRNKTLIKPDSMAIEKVIKRNEWNNYRVRAENGRIRIWLNDSPMIDYTEKDKSIPQSGLIAFQIHGGGKAQVAYKNIMVEELR
ncbi:DUF1080 domain-containing protein [Rhodocytophaga rosea]|uniref:DUF1080 domain-containing protein n=1 Tax=Rhodocytophaga rosea TaxID=2704465 RepID=A0A6C0GM29_9BACT|nr:DUF1080 domain-containing protein [Rhodocytophaga rosea]QHT68997.1 DUF1080 domain-containing protein [Rhodocytophaga rosea]